MSSAVRCGYGQRWIALRAGYLGMVFQPMMLEQFTTEAPRSGVDQEVDGSSPPSCTTYMVGRV
jgi:hypothetical protein